MRRDAGIDIGADAFHAGFSGPLKAGLDAGGVAFGGCLAGGQEAGLDGGLGFRLGQGGGYYDRFLSGRDLFSVGLARDALMLEEVPREAHDCAVRCLVTESRVLRF